MVRLKPDTTSLPVEDLDAGDRSEARSAGVRNANRIQAELGGSRERIAQLGKSPAVAVPLADHATVDPVSVPAAVPCTFSPPAQFALNEPFAVVDVCSVAFHLKSVHVEAAGIVLDVADAHVPMSAATPVELGLVIVVLFSMPTQAADAAATASAHAIM